MMLQRSGVELLKHNKTVIDKREQSLLSWLYATDNNTKTLYQLLVYVGILYLTSSILTDSIKAHRLRWKALEAFQPLPLKSLLMVFLVDFNLHIGAFAVYWLFKLWVKMRSAATGRTLLIVPAVTVVDSLFSILYVSIIISSFIYIIYVNNRIRITLFYKLMLPTEQVRLCMKSYAFIRENAYKVLYPWHKDDTSGPAVWYKGQMSPSIGSFKQYCYFLFAPTLLYRDHYPRSNRSFTVKRFVTHFGLLILGIALFHELFAMPQVDNLHWSNVVSSFMHGLPFCIFYGAVLNLMLHSWFNIGSEFSQFGNRTFYEDWWRSSSYIEFYRKWNTLPYQFNYEYIYRDLKNITSNKAVAMFLMLLVSSLVHEFIIYVGFGYVVPLTTVLFAGMGTIVFLVRFEGTFAVVSTFHLGIYILVWNVSMETNARRLCPREESVIDLCYPRLFECIAKYSF